MNGTKIKTYLEMAERHVNEIGFYLDHQRQIVVELERRGRGQSETAKLAKEILKSFEIAQKAYVAHRNILREAIERERKPVVP